MGVLWLADQGMIQGESQGVEGRRRGGRRGGCHSAPHAGQQRLSPVLTSGHGRPRLPSAFFKMRRIWAKNSTPSPGFLPRKARLGGQQTHPDAQG